MPQVMIVCPVTERRVRIGMEAEVGPGFRRSVPHSGTVSCDACGRIHNWFRQEAVLEGVAAPRRRERPAPSAPGGIRYVLRPVDLAHR